MMALIRSAICALLGVFALLAGTGVAFADDPEVFRRSDLHCPPHGGALEPIEGKDTVTAGPPRTVKDWLLQRYHWGDHEGNDLTVDILCVAAGDFISMRITQNKRGAPDTVLAEPGGIKPVADPGRCCPFIDATNFGPVVELPTTAFVEDTLIPRLIGRISKNPHLPHRLDNDPTHDYHKTLVWILSGRALKGTIGEDKNEKLVFEGDFSTPRNPNGKDGSALDDVEKENLRVLYREERGHVDEMEKGPISWA